MENRFKRIFSVSVVLLSLDAEDFLCCEVNGNYA